MGGGGGEKERGETLICCSACDAVIGRFLHVPCLGIATLVYQDGALTNHAARPGL